MDDETLKVHIKTLRHERAEYVKHRKPDRVESIDIELAKYGIDPPAAKPKKKD